MDTQVIKFDLRGAGKDFKILNATNGGPWYIRHANDQFRSNFAEYKAARIPYSRNHDSGDYDVYGGPYSYDISKIFPDFNADENDPASYDFACTDEAILCTLEAGTETFFRLGETIEHHIKKHKTLPPKDFKKWARICEHIIRHYNEGWADGYRLNIEYWEIWNEPDLDPDDSDNKRTWGGTKADYFDLYETAAKHLKKCFPHLKIGGPALAYNEEWAEDFLAEMAKRGAPMDFFSWHIYTKKPPYVIEKAERLKNMLIQNGYGSAESLLNEWNYIKGWTEEFKESIVTIHGMKGAAFITACMSLAPESDALDMLMYYATTPSAFCGLFDFYTYEPLKSYYPMMWYGKFYDGYTYVRCENTPENIYALCGKDKNGKILCILTHYSDDNRPPKKLKLDFGKEAEYEIYMLDEEHDGGLICKTSDLGFELKCNSCILLKEV